MKLSDYLHKNKITRAQCAADLGVTEVTIYRYLSGMRKPASDMYPKIAEYTGFQVMPNDFMSIGSKQ